jgi:hypothetical protein
MTLCAASSSGGSIPTTPTAWSAGAGDAIRKPITAHMAALGHRPRAGEAAHRIVLDYARHRLDGVLTADQINDADAIRRDRGLAEVSLGGPLDFGTLRRTQTPATATDSGVVRGPGGGIGTGQRTGPHALDDRSRSPER